jgi:maltooligosyltrehalose trehalohydrolase
MTMCGPFTPMLFMGEEWAASTPFQFFTAHLDPGLAKATAEGRVKEFEQMGWDPAVVPDCQDPATFERSKLDWSEPAGGRHARLLASYRRLAELRRSLPELTDPAFSSLSATSDEGTRLFTLRRGTLLVAVNFGTEAARVAATGEVLFTTPTPVTVEAASTVLPPHTGVLLRAPRADDT